MNEGDCVLFPYVVQQTRLTAAAGHPRSRPTALYRESAILLRPCSHAETILGRLGRTSGFNAILGRLGRQSITSFTDDHQAPRSASRELARRNPDRDVAERCELTGTGSPSFEECQSDGLVDCYDVSLPLTFDVSVLTLVIRWETRTPLSTYSRVRSTC